MVANLFEHVMAAVELGVELEALLQPVVAGDRVGQRQGPVEQRGVEAQGVARGAEFHRAAEYPFIGGGVQRWPVGQAHPQRADTGAEQVLQHGEQRGQAQLAVEHRQLRRVAITDGDQASLVAILFQTQLEISAQKRRAVERDGQGIAQGAAGEHGVAEHAVGGHVHAQAEGQAQGGVAGVGQRIGEDAQFLGVGDQLVRRLQVAAGHAAALQEQPSVGVAAGQGRHRQGDGVQGGECAFFR
ncbi:hypothetical protein D9M73_165830 [compost metagenome]